MKLNLIVCFLIFSSIINAQSTKELDAKNGFKTFVLGSPIENYEQFYINDWNNPNLRLRDELELKKEKYEEQFIYIYNSEEYRVDTPYAKIGEIPIKSITLKFFNKKMTNIILELNEDDYFAIFNVFKEAYGTPDYLENEGCGENIKAEWDGELVILKSMLKSTSYVSSKESSVNVEFSKYEKTNSLKEKIKLGVKDI